MAEQSNLSIAKWLWRCRIDTFCNGQSLFVEHRKQFAICKWSAASRAASFVNCILVMIGRASPFENVGSASVTRASRFENDQLVVDDNQVGCVHGPGGYVSALRPIGCWTRWYCLAATGDLQMTYRSCLGAQSDFCLTR